MKFSVFMMPLHLPSENPSLALERDIRMIDRCEDLGFDEFFIGEHHSAGWETISNPEMVLAKASVTAKRIKLGSSMVSLPFHHPFHVAERFTLLDHLVQGRAVLGVGPCSLPSDVKLFGVPSSELRPRLAESLDIIVRLLEADKPISYDGRFWQLKDMALQLRSYQMPRMKLALASIGGRSTLDIAAKYETILFSLAGGMPKSAVPLSEQWAVIEEMAQRHGTSPSRQDWRIVTYIHLAETREKAWEEASRGIERDVHQYFYTVNGTAQWLSSPDQDPSTLTAQQIAAHRRWIVGTPDDAIEWTEAMLKETGGFGGMMVTAHEWMGQAAISNSLELFARYVMPYLRGHTLPLVTSWERTKRDAAEGTLPIQRPGLSPEKRSS